MTTYDKNAPETIQEMFDAIAKNYDRANAILSFNIHKRWNKRLISETISSENENSLLDLCCGTGDIAFGFLKNAKQPRTAYLLDFSKGMLDYAQQKAHRLDLSRHDIHYLQADAQQIPLPESSVDAVTIAYGIRNVRNPQKCACEVLRVLRPGGIWGILELTRPSNSLLALSHGAYLKHILPRIGKLVSSNQEAYQYLQDSIQRFIAPKDLEKILKDVGFEKSWSIPLMGGIATLVFGRKM